MTTEAAGSTPTEDVEAVATERTVLYASPVRPVLGNGDALTWTWTEVTLPDDAPDVEVTR